MQDREHVDPMQVGERLDFHQNSSFPVFSPFPSRIPSSDLRRKLIRYRSSPESRDSLEVETDVNSVNLT